MNINNKSFIQDVLVLTSVPVISQILGILLTPVVTRLYTPEDFGLLNIFSTIVVLFSVLSTMGYHGAIILPKNHKTAINVLLICIIFTITIVIVTVFFVKLTKDLFIATLGQPKLTNYLWLTPFFVFFHGINQTLRYWNTRLRHFDNLAVSRVSEIVMRKSYQIPAGLLGYANASSLIYAELSSNIVRVLFLLKNLNIKFNLLNKSIHLKLIATAKRYRKFPIYSVWSELISRLPAVIISFMIIKYFGTDVLGYYGLSIMVLALPATLISGSVTEAFLPRVAMAKHIGNHTDLVEKVCTRLAAITIFPFLVLLLYSKLLFPVIFGSEWASSGVIAQILALRVFVEILFSPILSLIDILEKQELHLVRNVASIIITATALILGGYYNNFYLALWCLVLFQTALIIAIGGYMIRLIHFPFIIVIKKLIIYVLLAVLLGMTLVFNKDLLTETNFHLFGSICVAFIIYYAVLAYLDKEMLRGLTQSIKSLSRI